MRFVLASPFRRMCRTCIDGLPSALLPSARSWALAKFLASSLFARDGTPPLMAMPVQNIGATSCDPCSALSIVLMGSSYNQKVAF